MRTPEHFDRWSNCNYRNPGTHVLPNPPQHRTSLMQHIIFILERHIESTAVGRCWDGSGVQRTPLLIYHRQLRHEMRCWLEKGTEHKRVVLWYARKEDIRNIYYQEDLSNVNLSYIVAPIVNTYIVYMGNRYFSLPLLYYYKKIFHHSLFTMDSWDLP